MRKGLIESAAVAISVVLALVPRAAWAQASDADRYAYGPGMMWWGGGWAMIFGPLFMILFFVVLVGVVTRWQWGLGPVPPHHTPPGRTPLDILKERFARGEIDKNEFEERRRVLGD